MENEILGILMKRADDIFLFLGSENTVTELHKLPGCTYGSPLKYPHWEIGNRDHMPVSFSAWVSYSKFFFFLVP